MSNIPEARDIVAQVKKAIELRFPGEADKLDLALDLMKRTPPARPYARPRQHSPDPLEAEEIRQFARAHPRMTQMDIATHFGTNQGRVSEALHGRR